MGKNCSLETASNPYLLNKQAKKGLGENLKRDSQDEVTDFKKLGG